MTKNIVIDSRRGYAVGNGDVVIWSWIAEGAKDDNINLQIYAEGGRRELLEIFCQAPAENADGAITGCDAFQQDLIKGRYKPRMNVWGETIGIYTQPKRPPHKLNPVDQEWVNFVLGTNQRNKRLVLLFPQTTQKPREWCPSKWIDLVWKLHNGSEVHPIVLMSHQDDRYKDLPNWFYGYSWNKVALLMKHSRLVVGNDSAPVLISGTLGIETLVLLGPTSEKIFEYMQPQVECFSSNYYCTGCMFSCPFSVECDSGCKSLQDLSVDMVHRKILEKVT